MPNGLQQHINLENRLVLLAWLNNLFGYGSNRELLEHCKTAAERARKAIEEQLEATKKTASSNSETSI